MSVRSREGDAALVEDLGEFERVRARAAAIERPLGSDHPNVGSVVSTEVSEEVRKYRILVARERTFGWLTRRIRVWLGISAELTRFADTANALFAKEIEERRRQQIQIDELTELGSLLARELSELKQRGK